MSLARRRVIAAAALAIVSAVVLFSLVRSPQAPSPVMAGSAPAASTPGPALAGCSPHGATLVPAMFTVDSLGISAPVLSVDSDDHDGTMAPPSYQPNTVAWWNEGPKPGSTKGHVVLTAHTYRNGGALGNELHDSTKGLKPGAILRLSDSSGKTLCYRYQKSTKIWAANYDDNSSVIYADDSAPDVVLVVCWDFDRSRETWNSRIVFHASPVNPR